MDPLRNVTKHEIAMSWEEAERRRGSRRLGGVWGAKKLTRLIESSSG